ncbi:hypothetical protein VDGL01_02934 [Verticillium dahliae]
MANRAWEPSERHGLDGQGTVTMPHWWHHFPAASGGCSPPSYPMIGHRAARLSSTSGWTPKIVEPGMAKAQTKGLPTGLPAGGKTLSRRLAQHVTRSPEPFRKGGSQNWQRGVDSH